MSLRTARGYKILLWLLSIACLGGAGYLGYQTFFTTGSPARALKAAETAYARGSEAYTQKNWSEATTRFDEAKVLTEKAEQGLKEQINSGKMPPDEVKSLNGKIMWVKARAFRDYVFAKAQLDGKAIPEDFDPQDNKPFRSYSRIPQDQGQDDAVTAIRAAGGSLSVFTGDEATDVLKEALRVELTLSPMQWHTAEPLLREAVKRDPKDARAQYYLARYEFDQPNNPTTIEKKTADQVDKARKHLAAAKQNGAPYWRTVGLEAEILDWSLRMAIKQIKPDGIAAAERAIDQALFDFQNGAVATAQRGDKLAGFGRADGPGLATVLRIAMERAVAEARKPGGRPDRVRTVAQAGLEITRKMADDPSAKSFLPDALDVVTMNAVAAQPYMALTKSDADAWRGYMAGMQDVLTKAGDTNRSIPMVKFRLAQMGFGDATIAAKAGDADQFRTIVNKAIGQAEEGLKIAEEAKLPGQQIDELYMHLAEWKIMTGAKAEAVEPLLSRLRVSSVPKVKQTGQFLEAVIAERQGKLDKARKLLQPLATDKSKDADLARRANLILANLNMVLGDPAAALVSLRELEPMYRQVDDLPPIERAWQEELGRGGMEENAALQIRANLAIALQIAQQYRIENPKTPTPGELIKGNYDAALGLMKSLRAPSTSDRLARLSFVQFYLASNHKNDAETMLTDLAADYADNIDVLRTRCVVLSAPDDTTSGAPNPNGVARADVLIRDFLKHYPGEKAGRLFQAEWLLRTNRAERALEYLKNPDNFPDSRDVVVTRLLGAALLQTGHREEAQKILSTLPNDPKLDTVLIQTAVTRESGDKQLKEALGRYENQGRFRIYEAAQKLKDGKYEEAIQGFASAIEFTEVGATAKAGIVLSLANYANANPAKARDKAIQMSTEMPDEAGIYLAAADAALGLNEIGDPTDKWENTKTMYAALGKWETVALKNGMQRSDLVLPKAKARLLAGDPNGAKREAANALAQKPDHVPTMLLLAEMSLMPPVDTTRARELHDAAVKIDATNPMLPYLDARIKELSGDWTGAAAVYQRLISESPRNSSPYAGIVAALDASGQQETALRFARDWYTNVPDDIRPGIDVIRLMTKLGKKPDAVKFADDFVIKLVADARKKIADANPPLSKDETDKAIDNARSAALLSTATGFLRAKAYDEAEARVTEVLKAFPTHYSAMLFLGDIATVTKQWDKALAVYREILKENPRHFIAGNNLAWILAEKRNDPVSALAVVEEVRKGRAGDKPIGGERLPPDFLDTIGVVYMKLNRAEKFADMRAVFEAATRRYTNDPRMYLYLGQAQAANGERSKALESLDTALRLTGTKNGLPEDQNKTVIDAAQAALKKLRG